MPRGIERPRPESTEGYERLRRLMEKQARRGSPSARTRRAVAMAQDRSFMQMALAIGLFILLLAVWTWWQAHRLGLHLFSSFR
jgi:hypothetical protein